MRLFEAILDANQRKLAGDRSAAVASATLKDALPLAALTCIDARLNLLLPDMLGLANEELVWLRNAGNVVTGPLSSTMRSLALACAIKGAKEIAIIGHADCRVGQTTALQLLERLAALGVDRHSLPDNLVEFFGLFGTERQNVIHSVEIVRSSPLIGRKIPVHGLIIDLPNGKLDWIVNGYDAPVASASPNAQPLFAKAEQTLNAFAQIGHAASEEFKIPDTKIGEIVSLAQDWLERAERVTQVVAPSAPASTPPVPPPALPAKPAGNPLATLQERMRQMRNLNPPRRR